MSTYVAKAPYCARHPAALAMYCSDGRFTESVEELLHHLGHQRLDTLTLPGGAGLLNPWASSVLESQHVLRAAQMLIRSHGITEVVLLAHAGCGHYKTICPTLSPDEVKDRQVADLAIAAQALDDEHVTVHRYWLEPDGDSVKFERLAEPM